MVLLWNLIIVFTGGLNSHYHHPIVYLNNMASINFYISAFGFTLAKANYYSITSDFSRKGIGIIPEFGFGTSLLGSRSPLFMLKLGYPFFNMLDENNSKVLNGIIMNLEFGIDLKTW